MSEELKVGLLCITCKKVKHESEFDVLWIKDKWEQTSLDDARHRGLAKQTINYRMTCRDCDNRKGKKS